MRIFMGQAVDQDQSAELDPRAAEKWLQEKLQQLIESFESKRNQSRDLSRGIKLGGVIVGGATTILIGLNGYLTNKAIVSIAALLCSTIITMLSAWDAVEGHTWKWVSYRLTLSRLRNIEDEFAFIKASKGIVTGQDGERLYDLLENALSESNDSWMHTRANVVLATAQPKGQA
jgi:hypothetical protein